MEKKDDDLDAPALELAGAVRRSRALVTGILAGICVLAVVVVVVLPNVAALLSALR